MDYTFAVEDGVTATILTIRLVTSGWSGAVSLPAKGPNAWAVKWASTFLRGAGSQKYRLHVDAEAAISSFAEAVAADLANGTVVMRAPTGSHQSIGAVERYHSELHGAIRAQRA